MQEALAQDNSPFSTRLEALARSAVKAGKPVLKRVLPTSVIERLRAVVNSGPTMRVDHPTDMPQAVVAETNFESLEARDWRNWFSSKLNGKGLEIGPLHRPMVRHDGMQIDYIDRFTVEHLRKHYPELKDLPLVEPQIIGDAQTFEGIADATYDFVISAHVIEHMKDPIRALENWCRVCKPGGLVYLIVPDKRAIFDKPRVRTTLEHLILDYYKPSEERDFEHYLDYGRFVHGIQGHAAIAEAERLIAQDYSIHFHVFLPSDILNVVQWFSGNVRLVKLLHGPCMTPGSDEFHLLIQVAD